MGFFAIIRVLLVMTKFNKIVVIGAGTMGSGIAAHLANSNRQVVLLDLKGKDKPNQYLKMPLILSKSQIRLY